MTQPPSPGSTTGAALFTLPSTAGHYEVRLFAANTYGRIATSGTITVTTTAQIAVNGLLAPDPVTVITGGHLTVAVSGGPGNATHWVALAPVGASEGTYLAWQYLNGLLTPPSQAVTAATVTFAAPMTAGDYEL